MNAALILLLARGSLLGNGLRLTLTLACIALGVALGGAVHTVHTSALAEIDRAAHVLSGTADVEIRGPRSGFDDAVFVTVARHPDVAIASPVLEVEAAVAGGDATLQPDRDVIDVVTDDMPFLVDTLTMTLAAHEVTPELVVHPQLSVRRDVSGALREVIKSNEARVAEHPQDAGGDPDVITESWSHIEVAKLGAGKATAIAADLEHALWDVRLAVEDYPKMRAMALRIADELATAAITGPEASADHLQYSFVRGEGGRAMLTLARRQAAPRARGIVTAEQLMAPQCGVVLPHLGHFFLGIAPMRT